MREGLETFMIRVEGDSFQDGDVAFLAWSAREVPLHYGIMATFEDRATVIHADGHAFRRVGHKVRGRVVEVTWAGVWSHRCHGHWRYPGLVA